MFKRPSVLYPTLVKGEIHGPIRCLSIDDTEIWLPSGFKGFIANTDNQGYYTNAIGKSTFNNFGPFVQNGKTFYVCHLQKKATYFSLLYDPFIYHYGKFLRTQQTRIDENGVEIWLPGTEVGIYFRTPGWRCQKPDEKSDGTPWIWSWGRVPGTHLD